MIASSTVKATNPNFPKITPTTKTNNRPYWSVMIPTYNNNNYLKQTLESVLQQDPGSDMMQIEIVDDGSTKSDPESIVKEIETDRISIYRQPQNVGQIPNWNTCIERARGHWIHILHQDDIVLPGFYNRMKQLLEKEPEVGAAFCRHAFMDEDSHPIHLSPIERRTSGILTNWLDSIAVQQRIQFPSIVVKRETYEKLGGFCPDAFSAADWEMWKRIVANFSIAFEPEILAHFRLHLASETSRLIKSGANIAHTRAAIDVSQVYLPQENTKKLSRQANKNYALYAIELALKSLYREDFSSALAQTTEAIKCDYWIITTKSFFRLCKCYVNKWLSKKLQYSKIFLQLKFR